MSAWVHIVDAGGNPIESVGGGLLLVETGAPNVAVSQATAGASGVGLAARATRRYADLKNKSTVDTIYIGVAGTILSSNSLSIGPGESYQWKSTAGFNMLASANSPVLEIVDYYD